MKKIRILPEFIANQIAAGEVVQRPASVIKELVENSIDAGADSIAVIVKDAGKKLMHIIDNGSGMPEEDLRLSVKRHATSKIISQEDLENIHSFGFRGEALASIASVSLLEIRTKTDDAELGLQLIAEPNSDTILKPFATEKGTQVIVKNLFYNVPARRKFLKTNLTEFRHISDTMIKFALSNPNLRFTFYDDDTLVFDVHPSNMKKRIDEVLGRNSSDAMMELDSDSFSDKDIKISGFVGQPHLAGKSRADQYIFLNKRPIMSRSLSHAVFSSFEQLLERNQQPAFILNIEINPAQIDVNVHPQKNEVKFEDERYVYNLIKKTVKNTLKKNSLIPNIEVDLDDSQSPFGKFKNEDTSKFDSDIMIVNKMTGEIIENKPGTQKNSSVDFDLFSNTPTNRVIHNNSQKNDVSAFDELFGLNNEKTQKDDFIYDKTEKFMQIHKKYIINESNDGIIIIDQHNAHERILYERAIKAMNKDYSYAQQMLFPAAIELSSSHSSMIEELKDELHNLGYEFEMTNKTKIELTAVPKDISYGEEKKSLIELIEQYQEYKEIRQTDKRDNIAASFSCKSAIKTGKSLSYKEMNQLKDDLFNCEMPYVCPHGRPVILEFKIKELDNKFGRAKDLRFL